MLLEIKVKNFRSIKDEVVFSMVAESYKSKDINVFTQPMANDEPVRLLKVAALWGPNGSGKSNFTRTILALSHLLQNPSDTGKPIKQYDPFIFASETENVPTSIFIAFIGTNHIRFEYSISFDRISITDEKLVYYPNGKAVKYLYRIVGKSENIHEGIWKKKRHDIYKNQAFLSQFGKNIADEIGGSVYKYLTSLGMVGATNTNVINILKNSIHNLFRQKPYILDRLNKLIAKVDTHIQNFNLLSFRKEDITSFPEGLSNEDVEILFNTVQNQVVTQHKYYKNGIFERDQMLSINEASQGTQNLTALGAFLLNSLDDGSIAFIDELDTSLHPFIAKLIIELFQNGETNPKNAQLIFTTHDTSLLDEKNLRRDQIWFTEKDEFGVTDLYSLQDIEGVREDASFEKGYRAGKYRAVPKIPSVASIFAK